MDFYTRSQLPVISFEEEPEFLDRALIRQALCEKPCNLVFVEVRDKLYGIVSAGDIARAGNAPVPVNRNFTVLKEKQFMKAREIFCESETIREIPTMDGEGRLTGMCSRNDDLLYLEYDRPWKGNRYAQAFFDSLKILFVVRPPKGDVRRQRIVDRWITEIQKYGVPCELIDFEDIPERQREKTPVLLVDEETRLGAKTVVEYIDGAWLAEAVVTFRLFERRASEHAYDALIEKLANSGVKVYSMFYTRDETTEGRRRLWEGMRKWAKKPGANEAVPRVLPSHVQDFYGELNVGNYAAEIAKFQFNVKSNSVYTRLLDVQSRYLNIVDGKRVTVGQPSDAERVIWFFGACFVIGAFVEDKHTIESFLQERLNQEGYSCKVVNCGCWETPYQEMIRIIATSMKPGDVVVLNVNNQPFADAESVDMTEILDRHNVPTGWIMDLPGHCNHKVNQIYANELFERMVRDGALTSKTNQEERKTMLDCDLAVNSLYLDLHFDGYRPVEGEKVGGIAFHGNPFTLGHRCLIEYASKHVDRLFAILTEDEAGLLTFAERYAMALEGTKDLPNVTIVPGGPFSGSRHDFPVYFVKTDPESMCRRSVLHLEIFAKVIAKRLGISCRFIGDERHNEQMSAFNELIKEIMPRYGIDVIEIPRAQAEGRSISASLSRRAAFDGDRETLRANLPETTLRFFVDIDDYAKAQSREE